jgi:F-type H+-transporting ATPase subunit alpha
VVETLKQPQYTPFEVQDQVISIWAVTNGYLDDIPLDQVRRFEREMLEFMNSKYSSIGDTIKDSGDLPDDLVEKMKAAVLEFKETFTEQVDTVETAAADLEGDPFEGTAETESTDEEQE